VRRWALYYADDAQQPAAHRSQSVDATRTSLTAAGIGKNMGMGGVILHGLCSYGHAARAIIKTAGEGQPARLAAMSARFTSPVKPGDSLHVRRCSPAMLTAQTRIWVSKTNSDGSKELTFTQTVEGTGKLCLGGGVALLKPAAKSSKL